MKRVFKSKKNVVAATVSIDAKNNASIVVPNERYHHFIGLAHPHHYIIFPEYNTNGYKKK